MADLAASGGVSAAHLTRLFRAEMGFTAMDYLRRCRLERALHLLTRSDLPIKEVASEIGVPRLAGVQQGHSAWLQSLTPAAPSSGHRPQRAHVAHDHEGSGSASHPERSSGNSVGVV